MEINFIPLDYDYFDWHGKNYVLIIGRNEKGKRVCVIDSFEASFWAILKEGLSSEKIEKVRRIIEQVKVESESRITRVQKTELHNKNFLGKPVKAIKIFITNYKDAHAIADKLDLPEIEKRREYDIPLISKYIMDKKVLPLNWYKVSGEILNNSEEFDGIDAGLEVDICIKAEKIEKLKEQLEFEPRILAFDVEASEFEIGKGEILMISLYGKNYKKVLTWKHCSTKQDFVECFKDEAEMLEKFVEYVKQYNPDLFAGYFSDGFDLPYLKARAEKNKIKLSLGLDGKPPSFVRGRITSGKIRGIVHIDLFRFIETAYSQYLQSETLSLNEVASELLGERKKEFDFSKISRMKDEDWRDFFAYNLQDVSLTFKLCEKIWPDLLEFSRIIQEPLFDITRDRMSANVENYILHNLEKFNEIAEKRPLHDEIEQRRVKGKYTGAFVLQPRPGLYENIVMLDFTSMYSSVAVTYNLSLSTFSEQKKEGYFEVDLGEEGKSYFSKEKGFFPIILEEVIALRKKYKAEYKKNPSDLLKARSNAYKLLANASYGYQGFFGARYYCRQAAAATAALARKSILETIEKIKKEGFEVIYSDTDSICFLLGNKTKEQVLDFLKELNANMPGIMELELEDFYKRAIFVSKRTTLAGAKKKYALINERGKVKIRGFESVRRDWCNLARELQSKVLASVLEKGNSQEALEYFKEIIKKLKKREIPKEKLIIKSQLTKPLSEYKAISPHVTAAEKMLKLGMPIRPGMLVEYYVAESREKKKLVRERIKLPDEEGEYDINYYIDHQLVPAVENIFEVFGIKLNEEIEEKKQKSLSEF
ncbi:MAG: DNA-directed DNA polymerase [Candidatus Pacearchaeota archaeon]